MSDQDTIFSLATPPGRSALAIFRISGSATAQALSDLTGRPLPDVRRASVRRLVDGHGEAIDSAVVTFFRGPKSYTGEDLAELSVHGGLSIISALSAALSRMHGVRVAEPGEFTRRAFLNGRIDLTQAEAIADLIDSETEFQRRQALRILGGSLGDRLKRWNHQLLEIAAGLESVLDFSDEADVDLSMTPIGQKCADLVGELEAEVKKSDRSLALRDGFTVVLAGAPNAGKSSLFNELVGEDAAIVTRVPGTTRDLISRTLDMQGVPIKLVDTAGLRDAGDEVERLGVERATAAARDADLVVWVNAPDNWTSPPEELQRDILVLSSKSDILPSSGSNLAVSIHDQASLLNLRSKIVEIARKRVGDGSEGHLIRERHRVELLNAHGGLKALQAHLCNGRVELAAEECRTARDAIGKIVGHTTAEDVLGEIFARFCIGK